jgi:hypothetical protein
MRQTVISADKIVSHQSWNITFAKKIKFSVTINGRRSLMANSIINHQYANQTSHRGLPRRDRA